MSRYAGFRMLLSGLAIVAGPAKAFVAGTQPYCGVPAGTAAAVRRRSSQQARSLAAAAEAAGRVAVMLGATTLENTRPCIAAVDTPVAAGGEAAAADEAAASTISGPPAPAPADAARPTSETGLGGVAASEDSLGMKPRALYLELLARDKPATADGADDSRPKRLRPVSFRLREVADGRGLAPAPVELAPPRAGSQSGLRMLAAAALSAEASGAAAPSAAAA
eukprot:gnl/TRDRNA2_/TRDRNA2_42514_c0_seq1.p1 gnl/TRDRNA2_/TRDRNA2_42514_c0~~gnl/TRDRNA2_/TRDRNA2_42514_c0_seq1.p1  ORF type:complete len:246 (+),score=35.20 gnl/TRDRNA2_/TRDRNA2_42514_c0_seq1:74-739(+)